MWLSFIYFVIFLQTANLAWWCFLLPLTSLLFVYMALAYSRPSMPDGISYYDTPFCFVYLEFSISGAITSYI